MNSKMDTRINTHWDDQSDSVIDHALSFRRARHRAITLFIVIILFVFSSQSALAKVQAIVNTTEVQQGYTFTLSIVSDTDVDLNAVDLSTLKTDFYIDSVSPSSRKSSINGHVTIRNSLNIALAPKRQGTIEIPSFTVGNEKTDPIRMTVTQPKDGVPKADISLEATVNKTEIYVGEQLSYQLVIYSGEQLANGKLTDIALPKEMTQLSVNGDNPTSIIKNGKQIRVDKIYYTLLADKAGDLQIVSPALQGIVQRNYGAPVIRVEERASPINIRVLERPSDFKGVWLPTPELQLEERWDGDLSAIRAGESITREIKLTIMDQPAQRFPTLTFNYPNQLRVYSDKPQYTTEGNKTVMTLKQVLIPREAGSFTVPAYQLDWWNSQTHSAQLAKLAAKELVVLPSLEKNQNSTVAPQFENGVTTKAQGSSESLKEELSATAQTMNEKDYFSASVVLALLFFVCWIVTLILYLTLRHRIKEKKQNAKSSELKVKESVASDLIVAVKTENIDKIQLLYPIWKQEKQLTADDRKLLDRAIQQMLSSRYGSAPEVWTSEELLQLILRIQREQTQEVRSTLASIVPRSEEREE